MFSRLSRSLVKNTSVAAAPLRTNAFVHHNQVRLQSDDTKLEDAAKEDALDQHATILAQQVNDHVQIADADDEFPFLDPRNPPRLTYDHVKLIKNIDYSPIIKRARGGAMFTVDDVLAILEETGAKHSFKSTKNREHYQTPFIFSKTFDVFQKGQKKCPLCLPDPTPNRVNRIHYTNVNLLRRYINAHGMIISRRESGACGKHQRKLRFAIKNARSLALLSPSSNWHVPVSYVYPEKYEGTDQDYGHFMETMLRTGLYKEYRRDEDFDGPFDEYLKEHNAKYAHHSGFDPEVDEVPPHLRKILRMEESDTAFAAEAEAETDAGSDAELSLDEDVADNSDDDASR